MDFWSNFARQEKDIEENPNQVKYITGKFADKLIEGLLTNLCEVEEGEEE